MLVLTYLFLKRVELQISQIKSFVFVNTILCQDWLNILKVNI